MKSGGMRDLLLLEKEVQKITTTHGTRREFVINVTGEDSEKEKCETSEAS